jgi:hypothetical protein
MLRPLASALWIGLALARGQTFVVDVNNGPGAQFTEIQAAVAAVPSGSTLIVRSGVYQPVVIDGKGVVILSEGAVVAGTAQTFTNFLTIRNTLPQHLVTVRGLQMGGGFGLHIANCVGPVTYDGLGGAVGGSMFTGAAVHIQNSNQVAVRGVQASGFGIPAGVVASSSVVFEDCTLRGEDAFFTNEASGGDGSPGLGATSSQVQAVRTTLLGGNGRIGIPPWLVLRPGSAAVVLSNSSFRAMGLANHPITGGTTPGVGQLPALAGTGAARVVPQIPMTGTPPAGPGITLLRPTMPFLASETALPGGVLQVERSGAAGSLAVITISLRSSPFSIPGFDPIWIDSQGCFVETLAITTSAPLVVQKLVPNQAALRGCQFIWQAADLTAAGVVEVSNPSPSYVR